jgi:hypothetical protein
MRGGGLSFLIPIDRKVPKFAIQLNPISSLPPEKYQIPLPYQFSLTFTPSPAVLPFDGVPADVNEFDTQKALMSMRFFSTMTRL